MTEKAPPLPSLSPTVAKVVLTLSAVIGTLGGFVLLSGSERAASPPSPPAAEPEPLPELVPIDVTAAGSAPRVAKARPPRPITFTRSSR